MLYKLMPKAIKALLILSVGILTHDMIYPNTCVVTDIDGDVATITTNTGIEYTITAEDYEKGDLVSALFYDNLTDDVTDDKILSHRYAGQPETYDFLVLETIER